MTAPAARLALKVFEYVPCRASHLEGCFSRDRFDIGDAAHAISAENLLCLRHGVIETLEGDS